MSDPLGNIDAYDWYEAYKRAQLSLDQAATEEAALRTALAEAREIITLIEADVRDAKSQSRLRTASMDAIHRFLRA